MLRKKNKMFVDSADRTPHYSLRKLSVGVASVLLSTTLWMGANGSVAHADTINNNATATVAGKASSSAENKSDPSKTQMASKDQKQTQTAESTSQASVASAEKQNGEAQNGQVQEGSRANVGVQTATANDAHAQAGMTKQEPAAPSQPTAAVATKGAKNKLTTRQAFKTPITDTASAGGKNELTKQDGKEDTKNYQEASDDLDVKKGDLSSLIERAKFYGLNVTQEKDPKTYNIKKEALDDLGKQVADIQDKVTKYEADLAKEDISQGLSFANEHDASLEVTSGSDKPVNFIKSSAWLGKDSEGVYADGITTGGNISKSFSDSDISHSQKEGTGEDIKDWGNTYTGIRLKVGESAVARYTGLKNSVYIDKHNVLHKLSEAQVKYTLNETTADDGTANIFLSNSPNIALWYGAAGSQINGRNGEVDLTVDLTFYDENGKPITMGKDSNAWLDMSSLNNGTTKIEYFDPNGNTTKYIPGSSITNTNADNTQHADGRWYANQNNEIKPAPAGWDNPTSADRYYGAAIMELDGHSFHIGQKIIKYNPNLTNSRNVYSWFALDSRLATAYEPEIAWHEVTYKPQEATVKYIDDTTNKDLKSDSLEGGSNSVASTKDGSPYTTESSINSYKSQGYELVSDSTGGKQLTFDSDSSVDQHFVVHLKHGTSTNPVSKDVNRTINYTMSDGSKAPAQVKDSIHFNGSQTIDNVTKAVTNTTWDANKDFKDVTSPAVKGYTPDRTVVSDKDIAHDHADIVENVVYTPEIQKLDVTYHDDTTNKDLKSDSLEGGSNSVASTKDGSPYTTESSINSYKSQGYELVSDSTGGKQLTFDSDSSVDQHFVVHLKHGTVTVTPDDKNPVKPGDKINPNDPNSPKYQDDVKHDNLSKDAKQTVHYEGAGKDTPEDNVTTHKDAFTRTVTYDKVTGKSTTSGWSQPKTIFAKVDTPVVNGYTANKKQAGGLTATPDHPEVEDTVVYTPNGSIVPVDPNGNPIPGANPVPYETDPTDPTKVVDGKVPEVPNWTPKNGKPGDTVKPSDPTKDTKVSYDHTKTTSDPKVEGKQTVTYVYKDKNGNTVKTKTVEQDTTFTGNTTKDEVTGETTTTWEQKNHTYKPVNTPVEPGYTADKKIVGGETVTPDNPNRSYTVVYTPNGSIVPVDPNGNPIPGANPVPYETDPTDPTKVVDGKVPEVPNWTPKNGKPGDTVKPSDPTKDTKVPYVYTKVVDDKVPEVPSWTPKNGKPGDPVKPSDPTKDTKVPYDHSKTTSDPKVEGKQTVTYVYKDKNGKVVKTAEPAKTISIKESAQAQDQLPQTGEDNSKAALGLGLASILGGIGILGAFKRKKKEN